MLKFLGGVGVAILGLLFLVTAWAVYGPSPLPDRIPTHFNLAGHPDGWGSAAFLVFVPFVALLLYIFISLVARYPSLAHYPVEVTSENRSRLEHLALGMMAWLKVEMVGIFACLQITLIQAAHHPDDVVSLLAVWALLAAVIITVIVYLVAMVRAGNAGQTPVHS